MSETSFYALAGDTYYEQLGYASIEAVGTRAASPKKPVDWKLRVLWPTFFYVSPTLDAISHRNLVLGVCLLVTVSLVQGIPLLGLPMRYNASRAATVRRAWVIRVVTLLDAGVLTACAVVLKNDWLLLFGLAIVIGGWITAALRSDQIFINIGLAPAGEIAS